MLFNRTTLYSARKKHLAQTHQSGFSLLELIIVLVIIGIIVAAITLSIADTRGDNLRFEARRLTARLSLAIDEAILTNQEYGLEIENDRYRFLALNEDSWQAIAAENEKQLIEQKLPPGMEIQLKVDGLFAQFNEQAVSKLFSEYEEGSEETDNRNFINDTNEETNADSTSDFNDDSDKREADKKLRPQIYLMSSGELNPFTLMIGYEVNSGSNEAVFYKITASYNGNVLLEGPFDESMTQAMGREL